MKLYDYQNVNAAHLVEALTREHCSVDASDPGTGKTLVAVQLARLVGRKPLILCPKSVIPSWKYWLKQMDVTPLDVITYEAMRNGRQRWVSRMKRGRALEYYWRIPKSAMLIADEAHCVAGVMAQQATMVAFAKAYHIPTHFMSATLAESPVKMKCLGYHLGLHSWYDFVQWACRNGCFIDQHKQVRFVVGIAATDTLKALNAYIFPRFGCRVKIADLGDVFPENIITVDAVTVTAPDELDRAYHEISERRLEAQEFGNALADSIFARQQAEMMKVPTIVEMAKNILEENGRPVIFVNFRETMARIAAEFHTVKHGLIHGDDTDRQEVIDAFQRGELKVAILMIQAGGVGLSLHDLDGDKPRVALISPPWSAVQLRQTLGRIHRAGGKSRCVQRLLYAADTIEERVCETVRRKLNNLSLLNDGDLDPWVTGTTTGDTADD